MLKSISLLFLAITISTVLVGCTTSGTGNLTYGQDAYDLCSTIYNEQFRSLPGHRALVCGVSDTQARAYWNWDQVSLASANERAMQQCSAEFDRCFYFSDTEGMTLWARMISDNGGISEAELAARQNHGSANANAAANAFLQGLAGGLGAAAGMPSYAPRVGQAPPRQSAQPPRRTAASWPHANFCIYHDVADGGLPCICRDGVRRPFVNNNRAAGCPR